ncbi:MAG TPA: hypothetical protein VGP68_15315, partial [Gemmataceae bacterium]|nr:hypothetical protein [Gemmataceae bacterium]
MWERLWPGAFKVERSRSFGSEDDMAGQPPAAAAASASPGEVERSGQADLGGCARPVANGEDGWDSQEEVRAEESVVHPLVPPGGSPEFSD